MISKALFIGIDPASILDSPVYSCLDTELNVLKLGGGTLDEILSGIQEADTITIAINAPAKPNRGLVKNLLTRRSKESHQIRGSDIRLCEFELRERGIVISGTPSNEELCPPWMQTGFALFNKLERSGYSNMDSMSSRNRVMETNPHACFCVMTGRVPFFKTALEGRLQRQLVLYERGVRIKDPMEFFEEVTRYKIIHGNLPMELLYSAEQLDVIVAAYTAWVAAQKPEKLKAVGDPSEGRIYLPEIDLKEKY
ncbi:MAG: DUF429 domain-containing protein [Chloroflexi bacterium]|nr:DUF429 domain-containing protein [Chloroflexota bacterium]